MFHQALSKPSTQATCTSFSVLYDSIGGTKARRASTVRLREGYNRSHEKFHRYKIARLARPELYKYQPGICEGGEKLSTSARFQVSEAHGVMRLKEDFKREEACVKRRPPKSKEELPDL